MKNYAFLFGLFFSQIITAMEISPLDHQKEDLKKELQISTQKRPNTNKIAQRILNLMAQYHCIKKYHHANGAIWADRESFLLALADDEGTKILDASQFISKLTPVNQLDLYNLEIGNWVLPVPELPVVGLHKAKLLKMCWSSDSKELAGLELDYKTLIILKLDLSIKNPTNNDGVICKCNKLFQNKDINVLRWSPDTKYLAIATADNHICFWRSDTMTIQYTIDIGSFDKQFTLPKKKRLQTDRISFIDFSHYGQYLATSEYENCLVKIWDLGFLNNPEKQPQLNAVIVEDNYIKAMAWSPDDKYLALYVNNDEKVNAVSYLKIWDVSNPSKPRFTFSFKITDNIRNCTLSWNKSGTILSILSETKWRLFHRDVMDWLVTDQAKSITEEQKIFLEKILNRSNPLLIFDQSPVNGMKFDSLPPKLQDALITHVKVMVEVEDKKYKVSSAKQSKEVIMATNGFMPDTLTN